MDEPATEGRTARGPLAPFLARTPAVFLDGGLATELEARGMALDTALWSARVLLDAPDLVREVHRAYLEAGADCIATVTYQATFQGLADAGIGHERAEALLGDAVRIALESRDDFWSDPAHREGRVRPLVAASVGPYGAYLADGSEYDGRYGLDEDALADFHRERFALLAGSRADLLALETIPSLPEARALMGLLAETRETWAWISFQCRDARHLADGTPLADAVEACAETPGLVAVGANCVAPGLVPQLIREIGAATPLPVAVYPNAGEGWDAAAKRWTGTRAPLDWAAAGREWAEAGASLVGGCCRVGPTEIARMRAGLQGGRHRT